MEHPPLFSVLIANYNNASYIKDAVQSVFNQTYTHWEIIILDDCSTDNPEDFYKELAVYENIRIYRNKQNEGGGYTKRRCVELAKGDICGFLDADDMLHEKALEMMVDLHLMDKECPMVYSGCYFCDENMKKKSLYSCAKPIEADIPDFFNLEGSIIHFCTFKKKMYFQTEGINPFLRKAVDQDLYLKLYEIGRPLFIDVPLYYYRVHPEHLSDTENARKVYFWHWMVIFNTIKRRQLDFEDRFYDYFIPRLEYDWLLKEKRKCQQFGNINRLANKINTQTHHPK